MNDKHCIDYDDGSLGINRRLDQTRFFLSLTSRAKKVNDKNGSKKLNGIKTSSNQVCHGWPPRVGVMRVGDKRTDTGSNGSKCEWETKTNATMMICGYEYR